MPEWRPETQADWVKAQEKAKRVDAAGGTRNRLPSIRLLKSDAYSWTNAATAVPFNSFTLAELAPNWSILNGVLTCVRPGLWQCDARAMISNPSSPVFANTYWQVNGAWDLSTGGATSSVAFTSHGSTIRRRFNTGDTLAFFIQAGGTIAGVTANNGPATWLQLALVEK